MASWHSVSSFLEKTFSVEKEHPYRLRMLFTTEDERSQYVFVTYSRDSAEEEWVHIESPVGPADVINLKRALSLVDDLICGGLTVNNDVLVLRHTVPLANLDANEFVPPLMTVTRSADRLERRLVGGDAF